METIRLNIKEAVNLRTTHKKYLDFEIFKEPEPLNIEYEGDVSDLIRKKTKGFKNRFHTLDHKFYVEDYNDFKFYFLMGVGITLIGIIAIIILNIEGELLYFYSLPLVLGPLCVLYNYLKKDKRKLIMDREQGYISYPNSLLYKPLVTKFENTAIFIGSTGRYGVPALKIKHTNKLSSFTFAILEIHFWSFIVWYMDKNRPLPPGDAFDPYRQRDYERRKAAGFPKPLYPSEISTPEATPEQQAERERIGGW